MTERRAEPRVVDATPGNAGAAVRAAAAVLKRGGLVIVPTDTVYGIAADPGVPGALERLYVAKGRDRDKPVPLLAAGVEDVERFGARLNAVERRLVERFWPGALTLILPVDHGTEEGFRVPDCAVALALVNEVGGVLRVTSANLSGAPPALTAEAAIRCLGGFVDVVIDSGPVRGAIPSTVARVEGGRVRILREGGIPAEELQALCRSE